MNTFRETKSVNNGQYIVAKYYTFSFKKIAIYRDSGDVTSAHDTFKLIGRIS